MQVVRADVIRDVTVTTLGSIGPERAFVSGPFQEGDELILSLSKPLTDGTRIRSITALAEAAGADPRRRASSSSTASRVRDILTGAGR